RQALAAPLAGVRGVSPGDVGAAEAGGAAEGHEQLVGVIAAGEEDADERLVIGLRLGPGLGQAQPLEDGGAGRAEAEARRGPHELAARQQVPHQRISVYVGLEFRPPAEGGVRRAAGPLGTFSAGSATAAPGTATRKPSGTAPCAPACAAGRSWAGWRPSRL